MLRDVSAEGGLGFCHDALPSVLPRDYHGPLVVALDSNVLIDLQEHGNRLLNGDLPAGIDAKYADDLAGLADVLNLWLLRDIRLVVTPRSLTDAKRLNHRFIDQHLPAIEAIAESLAFQLGDWTYPAPSERQEPHVGTETGLPPGADRDLVLEAQAVGAHVFLTRDRRVLRRVSLSGPPMEVAPPAWLAGELVSAGVQPTFGGTCGHDACPYKGAMLAPDTGKWSSILSILGGDD
jgi:hypothetical protein